MAYTVDDIEKQLALLHCKNIPADVMRTFHTMKNRNSSLKRVNDSSFMQSDQLLPFKNDSQLSLSSVSSVNSANIHHIRWDHNKYRDHWDHKRKNSLEAPFSRRQGLLHSDKHDTYMKMPPDPEVDEHSLHQNKQNNSCLCGRCFDSECDLQPEIMPSCDVYDEQYCDENSQITSDLNNVYEKIRKLADLKRHQALQAGCYEPYLGVTEGLESPSVLSPPMEPPHTRCLVRVKPYKRHQMYQRMWKVQPAIGENFRFSLRQRVRQKMLLKEEVQLPHKMFVPNMYVVPTVKPRYQLRWIVRKCNHDYKMPPCGVFTDECL